MLVTSDKPNVCLQNSIFYSYNHYQIIHFQKISQDFNIDLAWLNDNLFPIAYQLEEFWFQQNGVLGRTTKVTTE